jgi:hypothetical protein
MERGPKMKKMVILMAFCSLTLAGCASYSFYGKSCRQLEEILVNINNNRIDPTIGSMDELFFSAMQFRSKHFSKWEE